MKDNILVGLKENIHKDISQQEIEKFVTGAELDHAAGKGYCYMTSMLYGLEEVGKNDLRRMMEIIKDSTFDVNVFDKTDGSVGWADKFAQIVTEGKNHLELIMKTKELDILRQGIFQFAYPEQLFILAGMPGHYIYVRPDGNYSNPSLNKLVATNRITSWQLWLCR